MSSQLWMTFVARVSSISAISVDSVTIHCQRRLDGEGTGSTVFQEETRRSLGGAGGAAANSSAEAFDPEFDDISLNYKSQ